ncbi:MAG: universal stress protein [Polyangiales bacterium]
MSASTIVCATCLTPAGERALQLAQSIASSRKAALHLLHVEDDPLAAIEGAAMPAGTAQAAQALATHLREVRAQRDDRLTAAAESCRAAGLTCQVERMEGRPWEAIVEGAERHQAQAVVIGPHRHAEQNLPERLATRLLGTTAMRVLRHAPCPVWVASGVHPIATSLQDKRWLVAVDFSPPSQRALLQAADWVRHAGGSLLAVHAIEPGEAAGDLSSDAIAPLVARWRELAQEKLTALLAPLALDARAQSDVRIGALDAVIAELASSHSIDHVVVGSHGRTGLSRALLGSMAERCIRSAPVPTLVVQ